jgi:hypothetical protein
MNITAEMRPWWFVRWELLLALTVLVGLLVAILLEPGLVDQGLSVAGL